MSQISGVPISVPSVSGSMNLPAGFPTDVTISDFITRYNPDGVPDDKLIHTDTIAGKDLTYGSIRSLAAEHSHALRHKYNLRPRDVILCLIPNCSDFVILAHSVWWAGGVFSSMNVASTSKDIAHALRLVKPTHVCVYPDYLESTLSAIQTAGQSPKVLTVLRRQDSYPLFPDDFQSSEHLPPFSCPSPSTMPSTINFSSGTTSAPKAVCLSHSALIANTLGGRRSLPSFINSSTREVFFPPYCHVYGLVVVLLQCVFFGNFTCGMHKFELEPFCSLMEKHKANWAHIVPPVAVQLANNEVVKNYDLSGLQRVVVAAAPVKMDLQQRLKARFGKETKIIQGYGMTECPTVSHQNDGDEDIALGSIGKPIVGTEYKLVDVATGREVKNTGEEGELWVRAPQVMLGYYGDPESTKNSFSPDGQWYRTGDIIEEDTNGFLWVVDRLKEMIKYKGFQVAPSELEGVLLQHSNVIDAAVCSTYDESQATELPVAYVALKEGLVDVDEAKKGEVLRDIRTWVDGQVSGYKKLRGGVFHLQQLPKTASGKILRKDLPVKVAQRKAAKL